MGRRNHSVDEPDPVGLGRVDYLTGHEQLERAAGTNKAFFGMQIDVASAPPWIAVVVLAAIGTWLFVIAKRGVSMHWDRIMGDIIRSQTA